MTPKMARGAVRREPKARPARVVSQEAGPLLVDVVGPETYATWVAMLRSLVPQGRTHRLAVVVAGMLHHAVNVAMSRSRRRAPGAASSKALLAATEALDVSSEAGEIPEVLEKLFRDAGVSPDRVNARGDAYSITDSAIAEFVGWENMPWE